MMIIYLIISLCFVFLCNLITSIYLFEHKSFNDELKNHWFFIIIVLPIIGIILLLLWENRNLKKFIINNQALNNNQTNFEYSKFFINKNYFTFIDKKDILINIKQFINQANNNILLQLISFDFKYFTDNLLPLLIQKKKKQKVNIFISCNCKFNKKTTKKLTKLNIYFKQVNLDIKKMYENNFLLIIDEKKSIYGNLCNDENLTIKGPIVNKIKQWFFQNWEDFNFQIQTKKINYKFEINEINKLVESNFQYLDLTNNFFTVLLNLFYSAKKSIKIYTKYFLPNKSLKLVLKFLKIKEIEIKIVISSQCDDGIKKLCFIHNQKLWSQDLWYETNENINCSYIIVDDKYVIFTLTDFNYVTFPTSFQPLIWFSFSSKNYFLEKFNQTIKKAKLIKQIKVNCLTKLKSIWYYIIYPFVI